MRKKLGNPSICEGNLFYLLAGILLLVVGTRVQRREFYSGLAITEYLLILLPAILYIKLGGYSFKKVLKLNSITIKQAIITILVVIFSYPVGAFLNYIVIAISSKFVEVYPTGIPLPTNPHELFISFLLISLSAGICEEVMFRGMLMSSYERLGRNKAVLMSAILFGIFHFNVQNLLGPIFLGIVFGFIVHKTNSLFSSIIGHATNNSIALIIGYFVSKSETVLQSGIENIKIPKNAFAIVSTIMVVVFVLVMGIIAYFLYRALPQSENNDVDTMIDITRKTSFINYVPIAIVFIIFIVINYRFLFLY